MAGLYTAHRLRRSNVSFSVLESEDHAGGRVFSRPERHSHLGLTLDEGANLINSTDTLAIRLMNNFGISYVRRLKPGTDSMHYLVDGKEYDQAGMDHLLFSEGGAAIARMLEDQQIWRRHEDRETNPKFINESIASYLARCGARALLCGILKSFFWSEYGRLLEELNLYVFFDYLEIDLTCPCFRLIPNVDEAYTVPGGTAQIARYLEESCRVNIAYCRRVVSVCEVEGVIIVEHVGSDGRKAVCSTKHVFFAAPLHSLKHIKVLAAGISERALDQARTATYARGTKLHLKFMEGFHDRYKFTGILLTDTGEQIWPSSLGQGGAGLLTVLTGPLPEGRASAVEHTGRLLKALDRVHPGLSELFVAMERTDAPMSYSGSFRPGETAHFDINDGGLHWTTIGEASSPELQGYLEGALRTADEGVSRYLVNRHRMKGAHSRSPQILPVH
ncbi:MAG: FAD-dependent oxidoreductase [Hyphomicrobiales bacterium]|nr:FAD-dependent oxidoreductase [Hyphomicrobiales bacterium]